MLQPPPNSTLFPYTTLFRSFLGASLIGILLMQLLLRQLPEGRARSNLWPLLLLFLLWVGLSFLFSSNHPASLGNLRELLIGMTLFGIVLLVGQIGRASCRERV